MVSSGPTTDLSESVASLGLKSKGERRLGNEKVSLLEMPEDLLTDSGLPKGTCVGALAGDAFSAFAYFYRPFNQLADAFEHYEMLDLSHSGEGFTLTDAYTVVQEIFSAALPVGLLHVESPIGTPEASFNDTGAGRAWVEGTTAHLESGSVRLSITPWDGVDSDGVQQPDRVASASHSVESITELAWD